MAGGEERGVKRREQGGRGGEGSELSAMPLSKGGAVERSVCVSAKKNMFSMLL